MAESSNITCLIIGDSGVGKTALIEQFGKLLDCSLDQKGPNHGISMTIEPNPIITKRTHIEFLESNDPQAASNLVAKANLVLICFSLISKASSSSLYLQWYADLLAKLNNENSPQIRLLVATHGDIRNIDTSDPNVITIAQGEQLSADIGAEEYFESSIHDGSTITTLFSRASQLIIEQQLRAQSASTEHTQHYLQHLQKMWAPKQSYIVKYSLKDISRNDLQEILAKNNQYAAELKFWNKLLVSGTTATRELFMIIKARDAREAQEIAKESPLSGYAQIRQEVVPMQLDFILGQDEGENNAMDEDIVYNPEIAFSDDEDTD